MKNKAMPQLLSEEALKQLIEKKIIINGQPTNAEGVKYDFTLSSKILCSKYAQPVDVTQLSEAQRSELFVQPGEVVFALTEEELNLPDNIYVVLMPKRKLSHAGIMVLGGLSVDPLYKGKLLIGLYNFSSSPFPITPGRKLIGSHFFELATDEITKGVTPEMPITTFPEDLVRLMQTYKPISTQGLSDQLKQLDSRFEEFKKDFRERDDWFKKFEGAIDHQKSQIDKILDGLEKEVQERKRENKEREDAEKDLSKSIHDVHIKTIETIKEVQLKTNEEIKEYSKGVYKLIGIIGTIAIAVIWIIEHYILK